MEPGGQGHGERAAMTLETVQFSSFTGMHRRPLPTVKICACLVLACVSGRLLPSWKAARWEEILLCSLLELPWVIAFADANFSGARTAIPALPHVCVWQPSAVRSTSGVSSSFVATTLHHMLLSAVMFSSK